MKKIYIINLNKIIYFLLALLIVGLGFYWQAARSEQFSSQKVISLAMFNKNIVIDAGHGGIDPGVVGENNSLEKDINLKIAEKLAEIARNSGANVIMSRTDDGVQLDSKKADLLKRIALAEENNADLYISIHANSYPKQKSLSGAQVFYNKKNQQSKVLADFIQKSLVENLKNTDREALHHESAYLLNNLSMAAVIVEVGFLSNAAEEALLNEESYQWQMAESIFDGVAIYYVEDNSLSEEE